MGYGGCWHIFDLEENRFMKMTPLDLVRRTRGGKLRLRFTKNRDLNLEEAYARYFVQVASKRKDPPLQTSISAASGAG